MKLAVIDLGSNSVKLLVAQVRARGSVEVLDETSDVTRVGEGLDQRGELLPAAIDRTLAKLAEYAARARSKGAERIRCVATAGLRGARNAGDLLARARSEIGLEVEIIHGLREAELSFRAPAAAFGPGPLIVLDVGGRSTEVITGTGAGIKERVSIEMGSVRMTERFLPSDPPKQEELERLREHVARELAGAPDAEPGAKLVGVSGTVLALLGVARDVDDIAELVARFDGAELSKASVERARDDFLTMTAAERVRGTVLPPGRADVIIAGAEIVLAAYARYGVDTMIATNRGVRYGLLDELASEQHG